MRCVCIRHVIGIAAVSFAAGVLLAFLLPGRILAFIEAAPLIAAGILLFK